MIFRIYKKLLEHFGPQGWWPVDHKYHKRMGTDWRNEVILGAILTQNTRWKNVEKALENLKKIKMDFREILKIGKEKLSEIIKPVGFYKRKAERIINFCRFLEKYGFNLERISKFDLESTRDLLLSIKGIGKETADAIMLYALGKPVFVIDSYTRRVFSRIGLIKGNEEYDELRVLFENEIKKFVKSEGEILKIFKEYHALIDELAKRFCKKKPICEKCPLRDICRHPNLL